MADSPPGSRSPSLTLDRVTTAEAKPTPNFKGRIVHRVLRLARNLKQQRAAVKGNRSIKDAGRVQKVTSEVGGDR